jgi:hypothetical protein
MLSFMRDQGGGAGRGQSAPGSDPRAGATSDEAGPQEFLTVSTNSRRVHRSTIFVVILIAIGLVCLWFMIRKSRPQAASAKQADEEAKIESAITRLTGVRAEMTTKINEIVRKFDEFSDVFQVDVAELSKNPFEMQSDVRDIPEEIVNEQDDAIRAALMRQKRMQDSARQLRLLSVMQSDGSSSCMINDAILQEGDLIGDFRVTTIGRDFVQLTWESGATPGGPVSETEDLRILLKLSQ